MVQRLSTALSVHKTGVQTHLSRLDTHAAVVEEVLQHPEVVLEDILAQALLEFVLLVGVGEQALLEQLVPDRVHQICS